MASEDRDRLFEKALEGHLRRDAPEAGAGLCLDAETLAAYYERLLSPEEMSAAKSHLVSCTRCQEILAQLETTEIAEVSDGREHSLVALETAGAPVTTAQKPASRVTQIRAPKSPLVRWAAPLGAIAAGLLLFFVVRDYRAARRRVATEATQIAENRKEDSGVRDYRAAGTETTAKQKSETVLDNELKEKESARRADALRDEMPAARPSPLSPARSSTDKKVIPPAPPPRPEGKPVESERQSRVETDASGGEAGKSPAKTESANAQLDSLQGGAKVQNSQSQTQSKPRGVVGGANAVSPEAPAQLQVTAAAPTVSESVEVAPFDKDSNLPTMSRKAVSMLAFAPSAASARNGKSIWKFGEHGSIAHSSDGGKTWKAQSAPVSVTLTSGTAPSKNVCWIAGKAGVLLRTADGGKHWQLVTVPIAGDLGGVEASDLNHASVSDAALRLTYRTSDGGLSWKQVATE